MPITDASLQTDLRMADKIAGIVRTTLVDMASIRTTPGAIEMIGTINGFGSDTIQTPFAELDGSDVFGALGETATVSETALVDSNVQFTVSRFGLLRQISDLANITAREGVGDISTQRLAQSLAKEWEATWMEVLSDAIDDFTAVVGVSGADMTVDDYFDAIFVLEIADTNGPYISLLAPRQLADLQESLRAEGGALQFHAPTADMLAIKGQGFSGEFLGVDIWKSSRVNDDSTDFQGAMWSAGGLGWAWGTVPPINAGTVMSAPNPFMTVEMSRTGLDAVTNIIGHSYFTVGVLEDAQGVRIRTDN